MIQTKIDQWLRPPTFADEETSRLADLQNTIFLGTMGMAVIFGGLTLMLQPEPWPRLLLTVLWLPVALGSLILLRRAAVKPAGLLYACLAWLILSLDAWLAGGVISAGFCSYTIIIVAIGLLTNFRVALIFAGLSFAMGGALVTVGYNDMLPLTPLTTTPESLWLALTANFLAAAVLVYLATGSISKALKQARDNEAALLSSNRQLQNAQAALQDRTGELTTAIELLENQLTERKQVAEKLRQREQELHQLNLELEQRIQERTGELAVMNEALSQEVATRQQAELALRDTLRLIEKAKREWEVTVDSVPQLVCLLDRPGRIKRANRTVERWNLASVKTVSGQILHQLFHNDCPDPACPLDNLWQQASQKLRQGQSYQNEVNDKILGRYFQWQVEPISTSADDRPQPSDTWGVVVVQDITERKQTELELARYRNHLEELVNERTAQLNQAHLKLQQSYEQTRQEIAERERVQADLERSEAQFRQVIISISDHIYVTKITATGEHLNQYISPNVEAFTGYPPDKFLADWSFWPEQVIYPADRARAAEQLAKFEQGQPSETEYRLTQADGQVIWVRDSGRVEPNNGAKIVYGIINNITARKEAEEVILRYSERLEILREIEQGILSAQSVEAIGQAVVGRIGRVIPCHRVSIRVLNEATTIAALVSGYDEVAGLLPPGDLIKLDQLNISQEWFTPLHAGQVVMLAEEQLSRIGVRGVGRASVMMVPLLYQAELIGTLNLSATKAGVFSPEHQEVAQQIANQLAIAIGQANLYHQVQRHAQEMEQRVTDRTRELSTLYEVAAVASQALELPTMLAQVLRQVLTTVRSDVGLIWLNDNQADQPFHLAAQQGLSRAEVDQVEAEIHRQGWLNRVMAQNQPLFLLELTSVSSLFQSNFQVALQSFLGLPIRATGHLLGVLTIFGQRAKQFNLEDIALLNTVADQIGVAIENIRLRQQAREAAIMAERERMARDLHDSVTQSLYSLSLFVASALEEANHGHLEPVQHYLTRMGETTQQALKEMRLMIYQLRPTDLERLGLVGALHQRLATVERRSGITARLIAEELIELPLAVEQELYRITQEALNNILKHAQATQVIIHLRRLATEVELTIHDNGQGFNPDEVETRGGLGLQGIRERVKVINGILAIRSTPAIGTTIEVRVKVL
jgi:PAS domain S-box-containing protein